MRSGFFSSFEPDAMRLMPGIKLVQKSRVDEVDLDLDNEPTAVLPPKPAPVDPDDSQNVRRASVTSVSGCPVEYC